VEIDGKIAQANGRLKNAKVGVAIQRIGDRLYLRGTFPPRAGSKQTAHYQQRLALSIHANPYGVSVAEKEARKVGALLDCKQFDWGEYVKNDKQGSDVGTIGYWLTHFESAHRHEVSATTWRTEYEQCFRALGDVSQPLSIELLQSVIGGISPNSRQRKRFCTTLGKLANFAGLDADFKNLKGKYSARQLEPRDLPSDDLIVEWFGEIKNPAWQWVYGMIATFGLRNHEVFFLDTSTLESGGYQVRVTSGKTGGRDVWAFHSRWVDVFNLRFPLRPKVSGKTHADYGERVSQYFGRNLELPFTAYDLRHCWAVRTMELGLDISLAAQQMGHSLKVHSDIYHRWINAATHQRAYESLMGKGEK
jgi:integrase